MLEKEKPAPEQPSAVPVETKQFHSPSKDREKRRYRSRSPMSKHAHNHRSRSPHKQTHRRRSRSYSPPERSLSGKKRSPSPMKHRTDSQRRQQTQSSKQQQQTMSARTEQKSHRKDSGKQSMESAPCSWATLNLFSFVVNIISSDFLLRFDDIDRAQVTGQILWVAWKDKNARQLKSFCYVCGQSELS